MKKLITAFVCLFVLISSVASAEFVNSAVVDNAGFLTAEQAAEIEQKLDETRNQYNVDVSVFTEVNMSGETAQSTADEIYDGNSYGYGENRDGIILYIAENPRVYYMSTCGDGIWIFGKSELDEIEQDILFYLKNNDYYGALLAYAEDADRMLGYASFDDGDYTADQDLSLEPADIVIIAAVLLLFSLLVALIATLIRAGKMKTAVKNNYAANYMKNMNLTRSEDIFLYSTVTRVERPKPESDTDTHVSSSGTTHGGQGGSY